MMRVLLLLLLLMTMNRRLCILLTRRSTAIAENISSVPIYVSVTVRRPHLLLLSLEFALTLQCLLVVPVPVARWWVALLLLKMSHVLLYCLSLLSSKVQRRPTMVQA